MKQSVDFYEGRNGREDTLFQCYFDELKMATDTHSYLNKEREEWSEPIKHVLALKTKDLVLELVRLKSEIVENRNLLKAQNLERNRKNFYFTKTNKQRPWKWKF